MEITGFPPPPKNDDLSIRKEFSLLGDLPQNSPSFTTLVKEAGAGALESLDNAQNLAKQTAMGKDVDSQTVSLGMLNASSSIRQFTGIISAATQSYKEIQHMQI